MISTKTGSRISGRTQLRITVTEPFQRGRTSVVARATTGARQLLRASLDGCHEPAVVAETCDYADIHAYWQHPRFPRDRVNDFSDPEVGELFDEALNSSNPVVTYTFTEIDSQDYFCRPHLGLGMTGTIIVTAASAVDNSPAPAAIQLMPNVPNPFNPQTTIQYDLSKNTVVDLRIFDLGGRCLYLHTGKSGSQRRQCDRQYRLSSGR